MKLIDIWSSIQDFKFESGLIQIVHYNTYSLSDMSNELLELCNNKFINIDMLELEYMQLVPFNKFLLINSEQSKVYDN